MAWEYSNNEYIKLFRKLINWEWYSDVNTTRLFVHCLLKANWKAGDWKGIHYEKGQFITSLESLSKETGLSVREVRTALKHLISTREVTSKKLQKGRIITINNWCEYQTSDKVTDKQVTRKRQGSDKQVTTDIRSKEHIRSKEDNIMPSASAPVAPEEEEEDDSMTEEEAKAAWEKWKEEHQKNESIDISVQE